MFCETKLICMTKNLDIHWTVTHCNHQLGTQLMYEDLHMDYRYQSTCMKIDFPVALYHTYS